MECAYYLFGCRSILQRPQHEFAIFSPDLEGLLQGCSFRHADGIIDRNRVAKIQFKIDNSKCIDDAVQQSSIDGIATERIGSSSGGAVIGAHFVTVTEGWPSGQDVQVDNSGMQKSSPPRSPRRVILGLKSTMIRRALLSKSKSPVVEQITLRSNYPNEPSKKPNLKKGF